MTNTKNANIDLDRVAGAVWGLAVGDAYGDPIEFSHPPMDGQGPSAPERFRITDDTQMSLAVVHALDSWDGENLATLRLDFMTEFIYWRHDPDNNRAPGATCLSALRKLEHDGPGRWQTATSASSAGCGSVMRAPWVGLHPKVSDEQLFTVAAMQAVLTHGPAENAFAAAALATLTRRIAQGAVAPGQAATWLSCWADMHEDMDYDTMALGTQLWRLVVQSDDPKTGHETPEDYMREGIEHVRWIVKAAYSLTDALAEHKPFTVDPADYSGQGWRAREAVAMAVGIFDRGLGYGASIRVAAWTRGDSDSTAAITGALVGAHLGIHHVPAEWISKIEARYQRELADAVRQATRVG